MCTHMYLGFCFTFTHALLISFTSLIEEGIKVRVAVCFRQAYTIAPPREKESKFAGQNTAGPTDNNVSSRVNSTLLTGLQ